MKIFGNLGLRVFGGADFESGVEISLRGHARAVRRRCARIWPTCVAMLLSESYKVRGGSALLVVCARAWVLKALRRPILPPCREYPRPPAALHIVVRGRGVALSRAARRVVPYAASNDRSIQPTRLEWRTNGQMAQRFGTLLPLPVSITQTAVAYPK
jgi:hypothetical protein